MRRPALALVALVALPLAVAGCGGASPPAPDPVPTAVPLRAVATCAASVVVPSETAQVTLATASPESRTIQVGEAVQFKVPRGARVGLLAAPQGEVDAQLCAAAKPPTGQTVLVATSEGYVRVGIQVGVQRPATVLLRVNP